MRRPLPLALRRPLFGLLGPRVSEGRLGAARRCAPSRRSQALARDSVEAYFHSMSILRDDMRSAALFSDASRRSSAGYNAVEVFQRHAASAPTPTIRCR